LEQLHQYAGKIAQEKVVSFYEPHTDCASCLSHPRSLPITQRGYWEWLLNRWSSCTLRGENYAQYYDEPNQPKSKVTMGRR